MAAAAPRPGTRGFTLLELVLVLAILATVTLMAAADLSRRRNGIRRGRSDRTLEELSLAIAGNPMAERDDAPRAFVEDLGRLPRAVAWTNAAGGECVTLGELFERPAGVPAYQTVAASAATVCAAGGEAFDPAADAGASLSAGWAGPYARSKPGAGGAPWVRDGWGAPFLAKADGGAENRISADGAFDDAEPGMAVAFLRHLGADAEPEGGAWARGGPDDADAVADLRRAVRATARCRVEFSNATAVVFRLYVPCDCPGDRDVPAIHVRQATDRLPGGDLSQANGFGAVFADVPRGRWMFTAHPEGEPARMARKWVRAE